MYALHVRPWLESSDPRLDAWTGHVDGEQSDVIPNVLPPTIAM